MFSDGIAIDNPMFGFDFDRGASFKAGQDIASQYPDNTVAPAADCLNTDMWCFSVREGGDMLRVLMLEHMAAVCRDIREFFWTKNLSFVCDTNSNVVKVLLNLKVADSVFFRKYKVVYGDTRRGVQVSGLADIISRFASDVSVNWNAVACDATLLDPANHDVGTILHNDATGDVFHSATVAQVALHGAFSQTTVVSDEYDEAVDDSEKVGAHEVVVRGYRYSATSQRERVRAGVATVTDGVSNVSGLVRFSTASMGAIVDEQAYLAEYTESCAINFALKRAGDWGMVNHCAKYNYAFATTDKLAALYARLRGVCVLYLNDHRAARKGLDEGEEIEFLQYSFAMCGTFRQRGALKRFAEQAGAGRDSGWVSSLAAAVIVASVVAQAYVGSEVTSSLPRVSFLGRVSSRRAFSRRL